MNQRLAGISLVVLLLCGSFSQKEIGKGDTLPAASLLPFGRYSWNDRKDLELISSAVNFGFTFSGTRCEVFAFLNDTAAHNYLQYELDGSYQTRKRIEGNNKEPIVIRAKTDGPHAVWIYKATEAQTGPIFIEKIQGKNLRPLKRRDAPLIEFIGNSITCGAAADPSEVPCGRGSYHDQHNAYYAYGPRVARMLRVNFIMSSVSGIGIYRNWNSNGPTMPQVYEKTDLQADSKRYWDFSLYKPAIVSIALGTNDFSDGDGQHERSPFDSAAFVSTYIEFIRLVKSKRPTANIALLSSPMLNGQKRVRLQNCLSAIKQRVDALYPKAHPVSLYFFKAMQARGCSGHPSVEDHEILARELLPFFNHLLQTRKH